MKTFGQRFRNLLAALVTSRLVRFVAVLFLTWLCYAFVPIGAILRLFTLDRWMRFALGAEAWCLLAVLVTFAPKTTAVPAFFADSTPRGRMLCILSMVTIGLVFVATANLFFGVVCWPLDERTKPVCQAIAKQPPWTLLASVAAAPSLVLTWWWRTVHKDLDIGQARREERSTRFFEAVKLLSEDKKPEAQLGAIYSLESLAQDSKEDARRIADTLCAFIRVHGENPKSAVDETKSAVDAENNAREVEPFRQPAAVQAAFTAVANLEVDDHVLDLRHAQLRNIELRSGFRTKVNFGKAHLEWAHLEWAHLEEAHLNAAYLDGAYLKGAHLKGAHLKGAHLKGANLRGANLSGARLFEAHLDEAHLDEAHLEGAHLNGAHLNGAHLNGAHLNGAHLNRAQLNGAHVEEAHFERAHLKGAHFEGATYAEGPFFPAGFDFGAAGMIDVGGMPPADNASHDDSTQLAPPPSDTPA